MKFDHKECLNDNIWLNQLFSSFIKNSKVALYFEETEKLKNENTILNLSIHPIRFSDDVFFNFQTNSDLIRAKLKKYEVNYDLFYHHVDIIKSTYLKSFKINKIKKNSLLIIGQVEKDKAIYDGKEYLSLLDYLPKIKEVSKNYDAIYFKAHPYAKNNKSLYKSLKKELCNVEVIHDNVYYLLSNENFSHVLSLNSSVLYEAKYFRHDVTFLYEPTFDFENRDIGIYGDYFTSTFWADILDVEDTKVSLPFTPNRLRKSLNDFWGYNEISDELILKDILKGKIKYFLSKYVR